jgi:hypothetical protein
VDVSPAPGTGYILPVTQGCDSQFSVNRIILTEDGQQYPVDFTTSGPLAETVWMDALLGLASSFVPLRVKPE